MELYKPFRAMVLLAVLLFSANLVQAQNKNVHGRITDSTGTPLPGISVNAKGTALNTVTAADGSFSFSVPQGVTRLVFYSVNYQQREIAVDALADGPVTLKALSNNLTDVVVIGYGTQRKKEVTGSIVTVGSKDFQQGAITTPEQLVAGKIAGVSITSNGGAPGSGSTIRIRGQVSLNASNDPLIIVDGVPLNGNSVSGVSNPLSLINPNDIETFTVLKDASATAIYGSRASNGIIMITTKKGKSGKPVLNFGTQFSVAKVGKTVDVLSGDQIRSLVDSLGNDSQKALLGKANTNWQDEIYQAAITSDNNLSVSGAFKNMPYRISAGYLNQQGVLRTDKLERSSLGINISPRFFDNHLKVDINLKGAITQSRFANQGAIGAAIAFDPTQPVHATNQFGNYFEWATTNGNTVTLNPNATRNPVALLELQNNSGKVQRSFGNIQLDYSLPFLPELHANLNLGYDAAKGDGTNFIPAYAAQAYTTQGTNNYYLQKYLNKVGEFYLNYNKDLKSIKSNINATAGYGYYDNLTTTNNYASFNAKGDTIAGSVPVYAFDKPRNTLISYYGRLIYTYNNKYILMGSIRTDGSSRFAPNVRWGVFPSGAFTWRINQENFLKDVHALSDLKLRLSYGVTGNQDGIGNYNYLATYSLSQNASQYQFGNSYYYMYTPAPYVADIKWEQTAASNIGLDYGFLNNRISGAIDFYYKKTKDLLAPVNVAVGSNFTNLVTANVGNLVNKGVEFSINATPVKTKDLTWDVSFNIAYNNTRITNLQLPGAKDTSFTGFNVGGISGGTGQTVQNLKEGYAPYAFYVYKQVYDKNGAPVEGVYQDLNKDGVIDQKDLYRYKSPAPKEVLGFSTQVTYRKWTVSTVLRANFGNYAYNNLNSNLGVLRNVINPGGYIGNATTDYYNTRFVTNQYQSDYYVQNASFLRMDNLGVAFNAGKVFNTANLKVTANCQNVFVVTKYKGLDPEISGGIDNNFYPRPRIYVLGLNLNF